MRYFLTASICVLLPSLSVGVIADVLPKGTDQQPLNVGFERGDLTHWLAQGKAFEGQPIKGDSVYARRSDMKSEHAGQYWIGTYERYGDEPKGTLTSAAFTVTHPYASFLIGGGSYPETRVELVLVEGQKPIFCASGRNRENMHRVVVDLREFKDKQIFLRLVDDHSGGWGHINFDDFRFHESKPELTEHVHADEPTVQMHAGLSPQEAAKAMTVPEGFSVTLFAGEPDVVQPIAFTLDDRGRLWVAEAYSYPIRVPEDQAKDRILIFEDTNGDGTFDKRKVFAEKLNLVSGLEVGFGGAWVGAAPHLLFIPDKDGDDVPDGPPQVVLDGWGFQDTHETLNAFQWGPDGWLYGCHGVFTHSNVGKPGTPEHERIKINAGVWRFHPVDHRFEVFAHGTSNPWGVDFNDFGECFVTACVIPHLFHIIPGAYYHRQAGQHFHQHVYNDIKTIADHLHYTGNIRDHAWWGHTPGVKESVAQAGGGHAHAGAMIYLGGAWPERYRGQIFMNNIHGARVNMDILKPHGSGFVGSHGEDLVVANDHWSQLLYFRYGPDGQVYMIDWYDKNQCHRREVDVHDRTNGRIFKITYQNAQPVNVDLKKQTNQQLVDLQQHKNDWYVRHSRRILQERASQGELEPQVHKALAELAFEHGDPTRRVRGLWALYVTGGFTAATALRGLENDYEYVRAWAARLACDSNLVDDQTLQKLAKLAVEDPSPVVRKFIAAALQKLPLDQRWDVLAGLMSHAEDANDHNLPLMYWYALEPLAGQESSRALELATRSPIPLLLEYTVRRIGSEGSDRAIAMLSEALGKATENGPRATILQGIRDALKGRRQVKMPSGWPAVYQSLLKGNDPQLRSEATALSVTFGLPEAFAEMRRAIEDKDAPAATRRRALQSLLDAKDKDLAPTLRKLLHDPQMRSDALKGLALYDDPGTPEAILSLYPTFTSQQKRDSLNTLASRPGFAKVMLAAVSNNRLAATDLSADLVRQLHNLNDPSISEAIQKHWGMVRETAAEKAELIARYTKMLKQKPEREPDPTLGRAVFAKTCQQCHTLFGTGGKVGPDITGSNRANLEYLLSNVLDPAAVMAKEYQPSVIATTDGRIITGIVKETTDQALTVVTANETLTIPTGEIEAIKSSDSSMMPDDLLKPLDEHQVRSLVTYLASSEQVPMLATADNVQDFFNGRDLTGWIGNPELWTVEDGQIVGRSSGLKENQFLVSSMAAADFKLSLEVKLTPNRENSGIQFRSVHLPDGHVRGYQADVGSGWWGKLYEELGRGLLSNTSGEKYIQAEEWNTYEIVAKGDHIRTWINGKPCVDLHDPSGAKQGVFAFQLHSGGPMEVRFRNIHLTIDPKVELANTAAGE